MYIAFTIKYRSSKIHVFLLFIKSVFPMFDKSQDCSPKCGCILRTVRGTWNFVGKPAALAQGCAGEAHLKHGCEYAPVAGRIRNFIEILSAPCRFAVASASGEQCRYPVKAGGKTVY